MSGIWAVIPVKEFDGSKHRLSDLLFILSRAVNEQDESLWEPGAHGTDPGGTSATSS